MRKAIEVERVLVEVIDLQAGTAGDRLEQIPQVSALRELSGHIAQHCGGRGTLKTQVHPLGEPVKPRANRHPLYTLRSTRFHLKREGSE